jgi:redox-sensitive bicupin YhaK (pirin superfamily)
LAAGRSFTKQTPPGYTVFAYVIGGKGTMGADASPVENRSLLLFGDGEEMLAGAGSDGMRFLLIWGRPIREPIAWRGPIVMNTYDEIRLAFEELDRGTFIKSR